MSTRTPRDYFIGLDLGQAQEFTALAVLERPPVPPGAPIEERRPVYSLRHLQRFPPATPYPEIVVAVRALLQTPPLPGAVLVIDETAVGRPVVNLFLDGLQHQAACIFFPLTISAGHEETVTDNGIYIPKKELVGALQALMATQRLRIPRTLREAALLVKEMEHFKVKPRPAQTEEIDTWRDGEQGDLVLALALAAWYGEKGVPPLYDPPEYPTVRGYYV
jgi:hypothetical protein